MGTKWEVTAWVDGPTGYREESVLMTQSLSRAIVAAVRAKRSSGCVRLVWRG